MLVYRWDLQAGRAGCLNQHVGRIVHIFRKVKSILQHHTRWLLRYAFPMFVIITIIIIIIIIKRGPQCKAERDWYTPYQSKDPSPTIPTYRQIEEKRKNSRRQKGIEQLRPLKKNWICSWNSPVPHHRIQDQRDCTGQGHWERNKGPGVLRGSAARRRISMPMCNRSTACDPHWHI